MFDIDKWQEIIATIKKNKMRTFLTGFSVAWGIFMLMILLGSGNGLSNGVAQNFMRDAVNAMWMWSGRTSIPYQGMKENRQIRFTNSDYDLIKKIPETEFASGRYYISGNRLAYGNEFGEYTAITCHPELKEVESIEMVQGRFINEVDILQTRKSVVLGQDIYDALFKKQEAIGEYIKINNVPFKVVGICREGGGTRHRNAYIPVSTGQKVFNGANRLHNFALTINAQSIEESKAVEEKVRAALARKHKFDPTDRAALGSYNKLENYLQTMRIFQAIKIFIWIIGTGTLIAGVVGVSNIMLIVVKERTKEIGIRKAIGASPSSVVGLILLESILITTVAGYIGLVLGTGLMEGLNFFVEQQYATAAASNNGNGDIIFRNPTVSLNVAATATMLLVIAGAIAGYIPAKRAARIKPIEALRDE
ncbi:ABC transporter permease [Mariniphaga sediminis]|uniref:ABC transporter permease n=1 Tax=Mariniphaga sediminis TaxID=1628158 RepID=A0A399D2T0_9BACT|nr:ABC transporter permease [Mariniphaga sediminis]RIH65939.1 ABC transporter permease [Mariniphaga sediminis]